MSDYIREGLVEGLAEVVGPAHPSLHSVCLVPGLRRESCSSADDSADPSPLEVAQEGVQVQRVRDGVLVGEEYVDEGGGSPLKTVLAANRCPKVL